MVEKILGLNELSEKGFDKKVIVGKRYYRDIENYSELYYESIQANESKSKEDKNEELPF